MDTRNAIEKITILLSKPEEGFDLEKDINLFSHIVSLYAKRKAGLAGRDFLFFYNLDEMSNNIENLKSIHEQARKYVNGLFKVPKAFRLKVPNIVSVFITSKCLPDEMKMWASEQTRTFVGGEFHSVFFIDLASKSFFGQGKSKTYLMTRTAMPYRVEFKNINPQNRSHYLITKICDELFLT